MNFANRTFAFPLLVLLTMLVPSIAGASTDMEFSDTGFHALAAFDDNELLLMDPLADEELANVEGGFFTIVINLAILPQINICILCSNVGQSNTGVIIGSTSLP